MSRIPLRSTKPVLRQAQIQLNIDRAAFLAARTTRNTDKDAWEQLLRDPTASQATIVTAQLAYRQSSNNFENARQACTQSIDAVGDVQDRRDLRQDYLQTLKDKRDPLKQVETFPAACGMDLPTVMSYMIVEWNGICSAVAIGEQYWEFARPAAYPAADVNARRTINQEKLRLHINLRRWILSNEAFAAVFLALEDAGYGISRHTRT